MLTARRARWTGIRVPTCARCESGIFLSRAVCWRNGNMRVMECRASALPCLYELSQGRR